MKDLKCGDFVWSKDYGNGIVYIIEVGTYGIIFEGQDEFIYSVRSDLFARGDEVEETKGCGKGTFLGITYDYDNNALIIETNNHHRIYVADIKHKVIDKLEVILTMNGKEIDAKIISKETWENLRRTL